VRACSSGWPAVMPRISRRRARCRHCRAGEPAGRKGGGRIPSRDLHGPAGLFSLLHRFCNRQVGCRPNNSGRGNRGGRHAGPCSAPCATTSDDQPGCPRTVVGSDQTFRSAIAVLALTSGPEVESFRFRAGAVALCCAEDPPSDHGAYQNDKHLTRRPRFMCPSCLSRCRVQAATSK
jgi:hypothetical protein